MTKANGVKSRGILLVVEDSPSDLRLVRECLRDTGIIADLNVVNDGSEAMAFLRRRATYDTAPRPDLILLDLNLPRMSGRQVLAEVKGDAELKRIPVVILTSSENEEDIAACYDLGANCYVTKPIGLDEFARIIQSLAEFWLTVAQLPKR